MKEAEAANSKQSPGRMCPLDYYYDPAIFAGPADIAADVLYVVGGLYGNLAAIDQLEALLKAEQCKTTVVFNGDFHWFDAEPNWFNTVEHRIAQYRAVRGNVETEISRTKDIGAGCGCSYPPTVDDEIVQRSNRILQELKAVAQKYPGVCSRLYRLPMRLVVEVAGSRVGIVHGDAEALAGWRFTSDYLDMAGAFPWLERIRGQSQIDVFASTHTCLPLLRGYALATGQMTIINNGAAGMPNFSRTKFGIVSRIAAKPSPHPPLYGTVQNKTYIDAIALRYNTDAFAKMFLSRWPDGTAAHQGYFDRIANGPAYNVGHGPLPQASRI